MQLELEHYWHQERSAPALSGLRLTVEPGTLTVIAGGSGSGKSTLAGILAGTLPGRTGGRMAGTVRLAGEQVAYDGGAEPPAVDLRQWSGQVSCVPQDARNYLSQVRPTVAEELSFGLENAGLPLAAMRERVREAAALFGLEHLLPRHPARLSGGQERLVAIAAAAVGRAPVLVLDEPLAGLDRDVASRVTAAVRELRGAGTAVVLLTQTLDDLVEEAGHLLLLKDGAVTAEGAAGVRREAAVAGVVLGADSAFGAVAGPVMEPATSGRPAARRCPGTPSVPAAVPPPGEPGSAGKPDPAAGSGPEVLLSYRDVGFSFPAEDRTELDAPATPRRRPRFRRTARRPGPRGRQPGRRLLDDVWLDVRAGECVALTGPNGAGKTTLLKMGLGLVRPDTGAVILDGRDAADAAVTRLAASAGLLFQNPADQLFERTVRREVGFGPKGVRPGQDAVEAALADCGLTDLADEHPYELPASQRRLVALGTVLARRPRVLILDEPTVSLDGHGREILARILTAATGRGAGVLLSTHDLPFARENCHRTVELGRSVAARR
ncbi:ABC transporter ATP-binding protein [Arthrobacter sp. Marseille-P9274]|uniref:ABC transporter ATP-binding protein n=1 Tax=Arthrobacter sp. Marseille-P9274 TaxID=2866572 RepID=UPI0021C734F4|nr:ABC transporter ATP-binding protein [Arthrobacter sp. Marseille-P9274]